MEKHAKQLHVRMSQDELDCARQLACSLDMTLSDLVRVLLQIPTDIACPDVPRHGEAVHGETPLAPATLIVVDRNTAVRLRREMRRWGYHYNQAVHALNAIAYYLRLQEADAADALEELEKVDRKIDSMNRGVALLRNEVAGISAHPIAFM